MRALEHDHLDVSFVQGLQGSRQLATPAHALQSALAVGITQQPAGDHRDGLRHTRCLQAMVEPGREPMSRREQEELLPFGPGETHEVPIPVAGSHHPEAREKGLLNAVHGVLPQLRTRKRA